MSDQGATYAAYIESALKAQEERRASLDARALAVLSTSGGLLTLVFALTVLVTGDTFRVSPEGARGVAVALAFFLAASVTGLIANRLTPYEVPADETLGRLISDHWKDDEVDARNICAAMNLATVASLRAGNNRKARLTEVALLLQLLAITSLVITLVYEASNRPEVLQATALLFQDGG